MPNHTGVVALMLRMSDFNPVAVFEASIVLHLRIRCAFCCNKSINVIVCTWFWCFLHIIVVNPKHFVKWRNSIAPLNPAIFLSGANNKPFPRRIPFVVYEITLGKTILIAILLDWRFATFALLVGLQITIDLRNDSAMFWFVANASIS